MPLKICDIIPCISFQIKKNPTRLVDDINMPGKKVIHPENRNNNLMNEIKTMLIFMSKNGFK